MRHDAGLYLRDLGSSSGTWVNGQCLFGPHALRDGDRIRIGQLELLFRSSALPRSSVPEAQQKSLAGPRLEVRSGGALGLELCARPTAGVARQLARVQHSLHRSERQPAPRRATQRRRDAPARSTWAATAAATCAARGSRRSSRCSSARGIGCASARSTCCTPAPRAPTRWPACDRARAWSSPPAVIRARSASVGERLLIGSDPSSGLVLTSVSGPQLELCTHNGRFWVRDLSGGRAFRAGSPIGKEFSEIQQRRSDPDQRHDHAALRGGHMNDAEQRLRAARGSRIDGLHRLQ